MALPYATIIVPIIDRAETLAISVETGLGQDRADIELLIACAGATPQVLRVAHDFARRDERVRVLDLPAAPISTSTARAEAVRQARSDRILILQDDDLWLPNHVATLGSMLEEADFAITISVAATPSGDLVAWPCTFNHPGYRAAYARGTGKKLYEAHYAFRRSSYDRLTVGWDRQTAGGCSRRLLEAHIRDADSVRWAIAAVPTALSLNSPPRHSMTAVERAVEMTEWLPWMSSATKAPELLRRASFAAVFEHLLCVDDPRASLSLGHYLRRYGLRLPGGAEDQPAEDGSLELPLTDRQQNDMATLFELARGNAVETGRAASIVVDMVGAYATMEPRSHFIDTVLCAVYGVAGAIDVVAAASRSEMHPYRAALVQIALSSLHLKRRDAEAAGRHWRSATAMSPRAAAASSGIAASVAQAEGRDADVVALLQPRALRGGCDRGYYAKLVRAQLALGQKSDAAETVSKGLAAFPAADELRRFSSDLEPDAADRA